MLIVQLGLPYWSAEGEGGKARWKLAGVLALTLGTTGVRLVTVVNETIENE